MNPNLYDIALSLDQIMKRLDSHGKNISDVHEKIDEKFDKIESKIDLLKDHKHALSERVTKLESERGFVGKILSVILGLASGVFGGWMGKNL